MRDFQTPGRSAVYAENGMCATSHPLAAQAALNILQQGGNALDAAIAGAVLLPLCEPHMTGLGGDCFALISPADGGNIIAMNGSGRAPAGANADDLRLRGLTEIPLRGAESVTIPGAMDAFCTLSADHGKLELGQVFAPAIHYAEAGVPVAPRVAADWAAQTDALQGAARTHYLSQGQAPEIAQMFRAPGQAEVLRRVAAQGRDAFYTGEIAEDMLAALNEAGGCHAADDFANTRCDYTTPVQGSYGPVDLVEHPPNGQGATAILMLNILKHFDLTTLDPAGTARVHLETEATKLAYDARNRFIADPAGGDCTAYMTAPETAAKLAALIDPNAVIKDAHKVTEAVHKDTVYITVVDKDRMAVSLIFSLFHGFGSGLASPKFGLLLQNRGAGFTLQSGHANEYGAGKRPMHTIIPGMLAQNGRAIMPFGVMGGQYQPAGHARLLTNMYDFGLDLQSAIDAPRSFFDKGKLVLESGYSEKTQQELTDMGHDTTRAPSAIGGAQAIRILDNGVLEGASDPRKDGCAIGY